MRRGYGGGEVRVASALAAFGAGSMLAALLLPRLLDHLSDRRVMITAGVGLAGATLTHGLVILTAGLLSWPLLLTAWALNGALYTSVLTPSGRLLRRSSRPEDRPALFAAQFALSHACWLLTYPLAGWAGQVLGLGVALLLLGALAVAGVVAARLVWPATAARELEHSHPDLPPDHPHLQQHGKTGHRHVFVIDDEHHAWPSQG